VKKSTILAYAFFFSFPDFCRVRGVRFYVIVVFRVYLLCAWI